MIEHEWPETLNARAALGRPGNVTQLEVFAPDSYALALTAYLCKLSLDTGMGRKFTVTGRWRQRVTRSAQGMQDDIDGW